jgi:hypothetical protein
MGWVVSITPLPPFTPGERTSVPIVQEAGWAPEPVRTQSLEEKSFSSAGDRTSIWLSYPGSTFCVTDLKIFQHGADVCTSPPKECVLRIFIALKNPSPRPGLNPRTFSPVASVVYLLTSQVIMPFVRFAGRLALVIWGSHSIPLVFCQMANLLGH